MLFPFAFSHKRLPSRTLLKLNTTAAMPNIKSDSVEMQLPELPEDWKPPSEPRAWQNFAFLCKFTLKQPNLEELWWEVRK